MVESTVHGAELPIEDVLRKSFPERCFLDPKPPLTHYDTRTNERTNEGANERTSEHTNTNTPEHTRTNTRARTETHRDTHTHPKP